MSQPGINLFQLVRFFPDSDNLADTSRWSRIRREGQPILGDARGVYGRVVGRLIVK
jgi:hypothetical protein